MKSENKLTEKKTIKKREKEKSKARKLIDNAELNMQKCSGQNHVYSWSYERAALQQTIRAVLRLTELMEKLIDDK